jgi:Glycosyltransferase family 87
MESERGPLTRSEVRPAQLVRLGCVLAASMVAIAFLDPGARPWAFLAAAAFASGAYLRALVLLGRIRGESAVALSLCLALATLWRVPLLVLPPRLSTDVYRYIWDGRVQRLGYDPYVLEPRDPALRGLHTDETLLMNHPELPTPYPAGAELFFRAVTTLGESARIMKAAMLVCDVATVAVLLGWLAESRRTRWWVLAYAWNPLIALEGAGNGHVDLLGALCLVIAARSLGRGRSAIAASALALAAGVKLLPVVVIPLLWRRIRVRDAALALGKLCTGSCLASERYDSHGNRVGSERIAECVVTPGYAGALVRPSFAITRHTSPRPGATRVGLGRDWPVQTSSVPGPDSFSAPGSGPSRSPRAV